MSPEVLQVVVQILANVGALALAYSKINERLAVIETKVRYIERMTGHAHTEV